ncbi:MAG: phosphatase PAP2 family protein, partial [Clostridia bacterium]|nr:phosphatase PAP2 family protein [Clostridia bacterium]
MFDVFVEWEISLLHRILESATEWGSIFWTAVTSFGEAGIFWIALSLILMFFPKTRKAGFSMGLALLLGVILGNGVLKNLVARPRPYNLD